MKKLNTPVVEPRFNSHSKVSVALTLLALALVSPPLPAQAEESTAAKLDQINAKAAAADAKKKGALEGPLSEDFIKVSKGGDKGVAVPSKGQEVGSGNQSVKPVEDAKAKADAGQSGTEGQVGTADNGKTVSKISRQITELELDKYTEAQIVENADLRQNEAIRHFDMAKFYMSKWDTELAEVELRAAIMYMPRMKAAHRDYCMVAIMRGNPMRALAEFMMVIGLGEPIPLSETQQKALREEASGLHYNKGLKHAAEDKWEEAISELLWSRKYTSLDPAVHRSLAFAYAANKQFDKAQIEYQNTLDLNPDDALAHADYAVLLMEKGHGDSAIDQMSQAVAKRPDAAALHVDLGWMAESKGDLKTAIKEFRAAVNILDDQPTLWAHLGDVLSDNGDKEEARLAYGKALKLDGGNDQALAGMDLLDVSKIQTKVDGAVKVGGSDSAAGAVSQEKLDKPLSKDNRPVTPLTKD